MNNRQIRLGIIGGAGPLAGSDLLQKTIERIHAYGLDPFPEIVLISYPFSRGLGLDEAEKNALTLTAQVKECVERQLALGCDYLMLACNTLHHYLAPVVRQDSRFIGLPQAVLDAVLDDGTERVLLLGTQSTCDTGVYNHPALELVYPTAEQQKQLDAVIDRVLKGELLATDRDLLSGIISQVASKEQIQGVILGCSDLPVLHAKHPLEVAPLRLYDSLSLPAEKLVRLLTEEVAV